MLRNIASGTANTAATISTQFRMNVLQSRSLRQSHIMTGVPAQEFAELTIHPLPITDLAFPQDSHFPTCRHQRRLYVIVPGLVPRNLFSPVRPVLHWHSRATSACMPVPETSVNENHLTQPWKDQVRLPRQVLAMQTKTIAHGVRQTPHRQFRSGIFAFNCLHGAAPDFWRFHFQRLRIGVNSDSFAIKPARLMRVFRNFSASWCLTSKST